MQKIFKNSFEADGLNGDRLDKFFANYDRSYHLLDYFYRWNWIPKSSHSLQVPKSSSIALEVLAVNKESFTRHWFCAEKSLRRLL